MIEESIIPELEEKGFTTEQINQILKFSEEGYKYIYMIPVSVSADNLRFLRKVFQTEKFSPVEFNKIIEKINANIDISKFFNDDFSTDYTIQQLEILSSCEEYNLKNSIKKDFTRLYDASFSSEQMMVLRRAIIKDCNNPKLFDCNIPAENMRKIETAFEEGITDDAFYNPDFTDEQLDLLIESKKRNLDLTYLANPKISIECMRVLKLALIDGSVDIKDFANENYTAADMNVFCLAELNGIDITPLLDLNYNSEQRWELYNGLTDKLDINVCLNPAYSAKQIHKILKFLKNGLDPTPILDPFYSSTRMELVYTAIKDELDYTVLLDKQISDEDAKSAYNIIKLGYKIKK